MAATAIDLQLPFLPSASQSQVARNSQTILLQRTSLSLQEMRVNWRYIRLLFRHSGPSAATRAHVAAVRMLLVSSLPNLPSSLGVRFLRGDAAAPQNQGLCSAASTCAVVARLLPLLGLQHPHLTWRFVFFSPSTFLILRPGLRRPAALRPLNHAQDTKTAIVIVDTTRHGPSNRNEADGRRRGATTDDRRRQKQRTGELRVVVCHSPPRTEIHIRFAGGSLDHILQPRAA